MSAWGANDILSAMRGRLSITDIPDNARVVRVGYDVLTDDIVLILESQSFPGVPAGTVIPEMDTPICHRTGDA